MAPVRLRGPWLLLLWCVVSASASIDPDDTVLVKPRRDVTLRCEAPSGTDLENLILEWTRSDLRENYVFLFRDGRPLLVDQHLNFQSRVKLVDPTLRSGDLSIRLHDVDRTDNGIYSCHVFSHSHRKKRSVLGTEPIRTVQLRVEDHHPLKAEPRTDVLLKCQAPEGSDVENMAVEWTRADLKQSYVFLFRDGRPLLVGQHPHFKSRVELADPTLRSGDLSIRLSDVGPSDSGLYACHVFSHARIKKRSVSESQTIRTIELMVSSGALRFEAGLGLIAAVLVSLFLQI